MALAKALVVAEASLSAGALARRSSGAPQPRRATAHAEGADLLGFFGVPSAAPPRRAPVEAQSPARRTQTSSAARVPPGPRPLPPTRPSPRPPIAAPLTFSRPPSGQPPLPPGQRASTSRPPSGGRTSTGSPAESKPGIALHSARGRKGSFWSNATANFARAAEEAAAGGAETPVGETSRRGSSSTAASPQTPQSPDAGGGGRDLKRPASLVGKPPTPRESIALQLKSEADVKFKARGLGERKFSWARLGLRGPKGKGVVSGAVSLDSGLGPKRRSIEDFALGSNLNGIGEDADSEVVPSPLLSPAGAAAALELSREILAKRQRAQRALRAAEELADDRDRAAKASASKVVALQRALDGVRSDLARATAGERIAARAAADAAVLHEKERGQLRSELVACRRRTETARSEATNMSDALDELRKHLQHGDTDTARLMAERRAAHVSLAQAESTVAEQRDELLTQVRTHSHTCTLPHVAFARHAHMRMLNLRVENSIDCS